MADKALCSIPDCGKPAKARSLCTRHYQSARAHGEISVKPNKGRGTCCDVDGCDRRQVALGKCSLHYRRYQRGDDLGAPRLTAKGAPQAFLDAFLASPPDTDDCVEWPFAKRSGYGSIASERRQSSAKVVTRVVCEAMYGPPPEGYQACHQCDNPPCINPRHLRWGSPADNATDAKVRGRRPVGEEVWNAKISESTALEILTSPESGNAISKRLGVDRAMVSRIRNGKAWSHINPLRGAAA